ncbi:hypothetical protein [Kitasatospora sp. NPDC059803]|uniref:hypothetical protein n=1 Tax=Kitasatospora sp. NPDC059803 TaxID=3346953 RepID=UPI003658EC2B
MTTTSPQATDRTDPVHARLQYQLAVFARRMDQVRTTGGGLGALDRAAYLLLDRLERHGPANVKALAESRGGGAPRRAPREHRRGIRRRGVRRRVTESGVGQGDGPSEPTTQRRADEVGGGLAGNSSGEPLVHRGAPVGPGPSGFGADLIDGPGQLLSGPSGFFEEFAKAGVRHTADGHVSPGGSSTPRSRRPGPASAVRGRAAHIPPCYPLAVPPGYPNGIPNSL